MARNRFEDQKGQWKNATPASVKKKQAASWKKLEESMKAKKSPKKGK